MEEILVFLILQMSQSCSELHCSLLLHTPEQRMNYASFLLRPCILLVLIMDTGNHGFNSPDLKNFLNNTGTRVLVEASPENRIWGIGLAADHPDCEKPDKWKGLNLLGFALMEVRDEIA